MFSYILFDLDGTVSDPKEGITGCVRYALESFGITEDAEKLKPFIGPPLLDSFMQFYGFSREQAQQAVDKYRERFSVTGKYENVLYPGMKELLRDLTAAGAYLAIASSKPGVYVEDILNYFGIRQYFTFVVGSELDGRRVQKEEVVDEVLRQIGAHRAAAGRQQGASAAAGLSDVVMIGDRKFDIEGARRAGIASIGVAYGYALPGELKEAGAQIIVQDVKGLRRVLLGYQPETSATAVKEPEPEDTEGTKEAAGAPQTSAGTPQASAMAGKEPELRQVQVLATPRRSGVFSGGQLQQAGPAGQAESGGQADSGGRGESGGHARAGKIARALGISFLAIVIYRAVGSVAATGILLAGMTFFHQHMDAQTYQMWSNLANAGASLAGFCVCCAIWHREIRVRTTRRVDGLSVIPMVILAASLATSMNGLLGWMELYRYSPEFQRISQMQEEVPVWLGIVSYGILAPLGEEVVFRRVVYGQLRKVSALPLAIVGSGLIFGLSHGNLVQAVYATVIGMVLALVYELYGSILAPVLFHAVANLFVYLILDVSPVGIAFMTLPACLVFGLLSVCSLICMVKWQKQ